ncbi:RNA polymerase sigma-70 factor [Siphonobacter aquaeclarae]|jgi:RNA polymerase sigma-70 factor (ECF subfamily)|uniref:RNA polymerase sigma-70 factor, ECF subfamily n=1 Tax=Siphonobacter aquaeclarae TaxID=563176 RepID=A0A1G9KGQ4_9BACT|nr:RNA polymerase sigma-70 factor [Siphonobacter aquaeclarae]MBO9639062.1 RNA polymerase sigma-70 factor [Siphonobacter aquaeclarae]SDL48737.1 RNA polymerase sigma-70 factor, ECF subfamily [Siphonobacter aquaeclarae]
MHLSSRRSALRPAIAKSKASTAQLFERFIQNADDTAFSDLYHRYHKRLLVYATKIVNSAELAEEIVLDVFMHFWQHRSRLQIHTSFESYLFRSVRNLAFDYLKHYRHELHLHEITPEVANSLPLSEDRLADQYDYQILSHFLESHIAALPKRCRLIFRMSREEGLMYREIAEKLDLSIKTVEAQMGRALKMLRSAYEQHFEAV